MILCLDANITQNKHRKTATSERQTKQSNKHNYRQTKCRQINNQTNTHIHTHAHIETNKDKEKKDPAVQNLCIYRNELVSVSNLVVIPYSFELAYFNIFRWNVSTIFPYLPHCNGMWHFHCMKTELFSPRRCNYRLTWHNKVFDSDVTLNNTKHSLGWNRKYLIIFWNILRIAIKKSYWYLFRRIFKRFLSLPHVFISFFDVERIKFLRHFVCWHAGNWRQQCSFGAWK